MFIQAVPYHQKLVHLLALCTLLVISAPCTRSHVVQERPGHNAGECGVRSRIPVTHAPRLSNRTAGFHSQSLQTGIYGGQLAEAGSWPWVAAIGRLQTDNRILWFCGGTLISPSYVITAAHCVARSPSNIFVRLGGLKLDDHFGNSGSAMDIMVAQIISHSQYSSEDMISYDIALLRLERAAPLNDNIRPICLAPSNEFGRVGESLSIAGWGGRNTALREGSVPVVDEQQCKKIHGSNINSRVICAGGNGQDACSGIGGGPLMATKDSKFYLVGIVSFGRGCGEPNVPKGYTRVSQFYDWIQKHWNGN